MIEITVYRRGESYTGLHASGHAGYAEAGKDIICAAVSVLLINAVNSIETLAGDAVVEEEYGEGLLRCTFPEGLSDGGVLLMDSLILGVRQIMEISDAKDGKPFVRLEILEEE